MASKGPKQTVHRSSVTGKFVKEGYANKHKSTTERQHIAKPGKKR